MGNLRTIFLATLMYNINAENALEYINRNRYDFSQKIQDAIAVETNKDMDSILSDLKTTHNMSELKIIGYVLSIDAINPEIEGSETIKVFVNISGSNENHYHLLDGLSAFTETKDSYLMTKDHISELSNHKYKSDHTIYSASLLTMQEMVEKGNGFNYDEFIETSLLDIDDSNDQLYSHDITYNDDDGESSFKFYGTINEIHMISLFLANRSHNADLSKKINNKYLTNYNFNLQSSNIYINIIFNIHYYYNKYDKSNMDATIISDNIDSHLNSIDNIYSTTDNEADAQSRLFNYFKHMSDQAKAEEIAKEIMIATYSNLDYGIIQSIALVESQDETTKSEMDSNINTISYSTNPDD